MATAFTVERPGPTSLTAKGLHVLLVEDNADSAASMALLLGMNGHHVRVASDGQVALDEAQADQPDVVLLDIDLPGSMDGYEVAKRLQERTMEKKPLLIALTEFSSEADRRHSAEVGIDLHLVKPTDMDHLLRLIKRFQSILDRWRKSPRQSRVVICEDWTTWRIMVTRSGGHSMKGIPAP
jgi:DNA-binding response OmpR family regulator